MPSGDAPLCGRDCAGSAPLGARAHQQLERPWIAHDPLDEAPFDAVFVHGGGTSTSDDGRLYLTQSGTAAFWLRVSVTQDHPRVVALGAALPGGAGSPGGDPGQANAALWASLASHGARSRSAGATPEHPREAREIVRGPGAPVATHRCGLVGGTARASRHIPDDLRNARGEAVTVVFLAADARGARRRAASPPSSPREQGPPPSKKRRGRYGALGR